MAAPTQSWPPLRKRRRLQQQQDALRTPLTGCTINTQLATPRTPTTRTPTTPSGAASPDLFDSPLASKGRDTKIYRNGYATKEKAPSYAPYSLRNPGKHSRRAFAFESEPLSQIDSPSRPLSCNEWSMLARGAHAIPLDASVKELQANCANAVLARKGDVCVIAPTGFGKSLMWTLPLLALERGLVLVITPFTSLGAEGEKQTNMLGIPSIFIHSERKDQATLQGVAKGLFRVVYICVEMLEAPTFAQVLYSSWFKHLLVAVYLDKAHSVHESLSWRPAYKRLHQLRLVLGEHIPLVALSATLPSPYRQSLVTYAGIKADYTLFNIGNFRPELSTVVIHMEHDIKSFKDLRFMLPRTGHTVSDIEKSIVYCDDATLLTDMLYWFQEQLREQSLPGDVVDIIHAGLSIDHQDRALDDFKSGKMVILLATEKLGAGLNVPFVRRVVQYLCSRLTIAKADQRRGHGARSPGTTAIGFYVVEKKFARGSKLGSEKLDHEDPGMVELVQTEGCCDAVFDRYLENPPRSPSDSSHHRLCCSNCHPSLCPPREYEWIMVDPAHEAQRVEQQVPVDAQGLVLAYLKEWRDNTWREHWKSLWPFYGPRDLISDDDLKAVSIHAHALQHVDDLLPFTHLIHWDELAHPLYEAVQSALSTIRD